jgi:hypothetical protein
MPSIKKKGKKVKNFPYTKKGKAAARKYAAKKPVKKAKGSRRGKRY